MALEKKSPNESLLETLFREMRSTSTNDIEKKKVLAITLANSNKNLQNAVAVIVQSEKTGWKEVIGSITKITGCGLEMFQFTDKEKNQLFHFSNPVQNISVYNEWKNQAEKIQKELSEAKQPQTLHTSR